VYVILFILRKTISFHSGKKKQTIRILRTLTMSTPEKSEN
jgi:hypothetical protein